MEEGPVSQCCILATEATDIAAFWERAVSFERRQNHRSLSQFSAPWSVHLGRVDLKLADRTCSTRIPNSRRVSISCDTGYDTGAAVPYMACMMAGRRGLL